MHLRVCVCCMPVLADQHREWELRQQQTKSIVLRNPHNKPMPGEVVKVATWLSQMPSTLHPPPLPPRTDAAHLPIPCPRLIARHRRIGYLSKGLRAYLAHLRDIRHPEHKLKVYHQRQRAIDHVVARITARVPRNKCIVFYGAARVNNGGCISKRGGGSATDSHQAACQAPLHYEGDRRESHQPVPILLYQSSFPGQVSLHRHSNLLSACHQHRPSNCLVQRTTAYCMLLWMTYVCAQAQARGQDRGAD